jgi:hypothetical protein
MEALIEKFTALPAIEKALFFLALPLILLLLFFGGWDFVESALTQRARAATDADAAKIDQKIATATAQAAKAQGAVEQIKEDEKKAVEDVKDQDAVAFYNDRFGKPDNK